MIIPYPVAIEGRIHLFSSRTQKLSFQSSKILGWRRPGKIENCWISKLKSESSSFLFYLGFLSSRAARKDIAKSEECARRCEKAIAFSNENCWISKKNEDLRVFFFLPAVISLPSGRYRSEGCEERVLMRRVKTLLMKTAGL